MLMTLLLLLNLQQAKTKVPEIPIDNEIHKIPEAGSLKSRVTV
jgi:hypothetical protein